MRPQQRWAILKQLLGISCVSFHFFSPFAKQHSWWCCLCMTNYAFFCGIFALLVADQLEVMLSALHNSSCILTVPFAQQCQFPDWCKDLWPDPRYVYPEVNPAELTRVNFLALLPGMLRIEALRFVSFVKSRGRDKGWRPFSKAL